MPRLSSLLTLTLTISTLAFSVSNAQTLPPSTDANAQAMLDSYRALKSPQFDPAKKDDPQYVQSYLKSQDDFIARQEEMAKAFYDKYPNDPQALPLMMERWLNLAANGKGLLVNQETAKFLATNHDPKTKADLLFARAKAAMQTPKFAEAIDAFTDAAPTDPRGSTLLFELSMRTPDADKKMDIFHRIVDDYPTSTDAGLAKGSIQRTDSIGKPFNLKFTDAITGTPISVQDDLKGKIVVIDFWATWCGPCVAEMPDNKKIYEKYKDQGVQFIGVSLDNPEPDGGLAALKDFVAKNQILWPQYYQGKQWNSDFSMGWGINSIPTMFIVDASGNLFSIEARGHLDTLIPELIAKRDKAAAAH